MTFLSSLFSPPSPSSSIYLTKRAEKHFFLTSKLIAFLSGNLFPPLSIFLIISRAYVFVFDPSCVVFVFTFHCTQFFFQRPEYTVHTAAMSFQYFFSLTFGSSEVKLIESKIIWVFSLGGFSHEFPRKDEIRQLQFSGRTYESVRCHVRWKIRVAWLKSQIEWKTLSNVTKKFLKMSRDVLRNEILEIACSSKTRQLVYQSL